MFAVANSVIKMLESISKVPLNKLLVIVIIMALFVTLVSILPIVLIILTGYLN